MAMPSVAICHMTMVMIDASAMNGVFWPGLSFRHCQ